MCRLPRRSGRLLCRHERRLSTAHILVRRPCAQSFWPGSWTCCHLQSLFRLAVSLGGLRLLAQSYVGKRGISKGIGRAIPKFVVFAFCAHVLGRHRRAPARLVERKEASLLGRGCGTPLRARFSNCAVGDGADEGWFSPVSEEADGSRLPWAGRRKGLREAVRFGSLRYRAREKARSGCLMQS
jgi:hypothetical protein